MTFYYLHDGQNQLGPFSSEELGERNITRETYVWTEGCSDWVKAGEIEDLKSLFTSIPPAFIQPPPINNAMHSDQDKISQPEPARKSWIRRNPFLTTFGLLAVCSCILIFVSLKASSDSAKFMQEFNRRVKTPEELRLELRMTEQQNPAAYLNADIRMRGNFIGEKVIKGSITSTATIASFKDVVLEISYLSKTESVIGREQFTIFERVGPGQHVPIEKIKTFAPSGTKAFSTKVVSATPID